MADSTDLGSVATSVRVRVPPPSPSCRRGGMVDTWVLKSHGSNTVRVRVPSPAPFKKYQGENKTEFAENHNVLRENAIKKYYESPNYCKFCGKIIEVKPGQQVSKVKQKVFCDIDCCHSYQRLQGNRFKECLICKKDITAQNQSGLCSKCLKEQTNQRKIEDWLKTGDTGTKVSSAIPPCIRKYIFDEQFGKCAICGQPDTWNDKDLHFVLDHIDGNAAKNNRTNLRLICPNCDSQLDTYKSRNKNSARSHRKVHKADEPGERLEPT